MPAKRLYAETATRIGDGADKEIGRWRLNAGSPMLLTVPALREDGPVRVIVELKSARPRFAKIPALYSHADYAVVGFWDTFSISEDGIDAEPHLIKAVDAAEASVLSDAVRLGAQIRTGVPVQVSLGAEPGDNGKFEAVDAGATVEVNGRTYAIPDDGIPSFILRGGEIFEASFCTFGADDETGRLAASRSNLPTKGAPMTDRAKFKAILATYQPEHHALVATLFADGKEDAEIKAAVDGATMGAIMEKIAKLEAENAVYKKAEAAAKAAAEEDATKAKAEDESKETPADEKKETEASKIAASGSNKGVKFGNSDKKPATGAPQDMLEACERIKANPAYKFRNGAQLRMDARAEFGDDLPDMSPERIKMARARILTTK